MTAVSCIATSELDALALPEPTVVVRMGGAEDVGPLPVIHHRPRMHTLPGLGDEAELAIFAGEPADVDSPVDELLELSDPGPDAYLVTPVAPFPLVRSPAPPRAAFVPVARRSWSLSDRLADLVEAVSTALMELLGLGASPAR